MLLLQRKKKMQNSLLVNQLKRLSSRLMKKKQKKSAKRKRQKKLRLLGLHNLRENSIEMENLFAWVEELQTLIFQTTVTEHSIMIGYCQSISSSKILKFKRSKLYSFKSGQQQFREHFSQIQKNLILVRYLCYTEIHKKSL